MSFRAAASSRGKRLSRLRCERLKRNSGSGCISKGDRFLGVRSYFFLARVVDGEFGTGTNLANPGRGDYLPVWVELADLGRLAVRPYDIGQALASGLLEETTGEPLMTGEGPI